MAQRPNNTVKLDVLTTDFQEELFDELDDAIAEVVAEVVGEFMEDPIFEKDEAFDDLYRIMELYCKKRVKETILEVTEEVMEEDPEVSETSK